MPGSLLGEQGGIRPERLGKADWQPGGAAGLGGLRSGGNRVVGMLSSLPDFRSRTVKAEPAEWVRKWISSTYSQGGPTVSSRGSLETKELVRQAIDIVDLVSRYVQLRRSGRRYVGLCPWHDDTRPSLQVNPERQSFKCWVCDIGGDVFSFVMKMEGVGFPEALAMLAEQAGVPLRDARSGGASVSGQSDAAASVAVPQGFSKRRLYQAMAWAEEQYHRCLLEAAEAEPARRYLRQRGINDRSVRRFRLGYSPDQWNWIIERAREVRGTVELLEAVGILAKPPGGGTWYDRFRGRLLFPIRDTQQRPVGFGGRVLPESASASPAKYVNSPETPLFSKSRQLYGLDLAREAMRKSRTALVMEGYTDCIMAHQCGFGDAVAVLGTALGEYHIRLLKRFVDRIVLVLDGDEAGQRRANEVLELFVAEKADLRIVTLPAGMDPADYLLAHGADALADLLHNRALDALEHAFRAYTRDVDLDRDVHGASEALDRLVAIVAKAPRLRLDTTTQDRLREAKILQRLAASFRVPEEDVRRRLSQLRRRGRSGRRPVQAAESPAVTLGPLERELLELLIRNPGLLPQVRQAIRSEQLTAAPARQVFDTCCRLADAGIEPTFDRLILQFDDPAMKNLLVELDERGGAKEGDDPQTVWEELITSFRRQEATKQRVQFAGALRQGGVDEEEQLRLLQEVVHATRARHGISSPTDG
ncbi:MAG TPA: DNA primase [Planctomycetes bacterium]|nr:DNA primase [Planctomycetota bacterium]